MADDDLFVRTEDPPARYDSNGHVKRYSSEEKQELKGPRSKLPGFPGDFSQLKVGQPVKVYVAKKKDRKNESVKLVEGNQSPWLSSGDFTGILHRLDPSTKKMTVRIDVVALPSSSRAIQKEMVTGKVTIIMILTSEDRSSSK